jgi:hypothetical protein
VALPGTLGRRRTAVVAAHERCPRCGSQREPIQEFCVECGLRLPVVVGALPALRRRWLLRVGWYPGDWVWLALPALAVATAGAAISIAISHHRHGGTPGATVVAPAPKQGAGAPAGTSRNGSFAWPAGLDGWTVVLASSPQSRGRRRPAAVAARAIRQGLPEVGVLDSSAYSSLHPGYYVVFSGVYTASADADTALQTVRSRGFGGAYPRRVSP